MVAKLFEIAGSLLLLIVLGGISLFSYEPEVYVRQDFRDQLFQVQAIDTMKYSRDLARERARDPNFDKVIERQMGLIVGAGATHVAIGTPYDEEFIPFMKLWVESARAHGLSVWFRGNFSGWERWFNYPRIGREEHQKKLADFLEKNPELFRDGDIFTPCHECENGGPGDPRNTGDKAGYRIFLIDEFADSRSAFDAMGKKVTLVASMNGDIAREVMDRATAQSLKGIVIDHYTKRADVFGKDISNIRKRLGINIGLGEFGAPIPDINGEMSESEQTKFVRSLLRELYADSENIPYVNYWVLEGGSTALVEEDRAKAAYGAVKDYYTAEGVSGIIVDPLGSAVGDVTISIPDLDFKTRSNSGGQFQVFLPGNIHTVKFEKTGYETRAVDFSKEAGATSTKNIVLTPTDQNFFYRFKTRLYLRLGKSPIDF